MAETGVIVRLSIRDQDIVTRALRNMGAEGERALKRIERAAQGPTPAMKALSSASSEARGALDGLGARAGSLGSALSAMGPAGLAAAAGIGAIVAGISTIAVRSREAVGQLGDLADAATRVGVAASTLQELRFAVGQNAAGSVEGLDRALQRLNASIGDLALNGDRASESTVKAFAALGISVTDAEGRVKSSIEVLREMADGLAAIEDPATRARVSQDVLGKSFQDILPLISQGGNAFDEYRQKARDAGAVLDEAVIRKAAAANDELNALAEVVTNQGNRAFAAFSDELLITARALAEVVTWLADVSERFKDIENRSRRSVTQTLEANREEQRQIQEKIRSAQEGNIISDFIGGNSGLFTNVDKEKQKLDELKKQEQELIAILEKKNEEQRKLTEQNIGNEGGGVARNVSSEKSSAAAEKADETERQKALAALQRINEENLKARGETIKLIEARRDAEIEAIKKVKLSEEERAEAVRKINQTAAAEIQAEYKKTADAQKKALAGIKGYTGPEPGSFRAAQEVGLDDGIQLSEKLQSANDAMRRLREENLQTHGDTIQLIEMRRDKELAALNDIELSERQLAEARLLINDKANTEISREYEKTAQKVDTTGQQIVSSLDGTFQTLNNTVTGVFADWILGAEVTAESIMRSFARALLQSGIQSLVSGGNAAAGDGGLWGALIKGGISLVGSLAGGYAGTSTGVSAGTAPTYTSGGYTMGGSSAFYVAHGAAFDRGSPVTAYATGGIVDRPTFFPMARGGTGLMGEAGPEAVLPLKRLPSGNLGVEAGGMGGAGGGISISSPVSVTVTTQSNDPGAVGAETAKAVKRAMKEAVLQVLRDERRPGGSMAPAIQGMR